MTTRNTRASATTASASPSASASPPLRPEVLSAERSGTSENPTSKEGTSSTTTTVTTTSTASSILELTSTSPSSSSSRSSRVIPGREWTESETQFLLEGVQRCGEQWEVIASLFTPRRTIYECSRHYYECTQSKRKRPSLSGATNFELNPPMRRLRKTYLEIQRSFQCTEPNCTKAYGTEGALRTHKRLKHGIGATPPKATSTRSSSPNGSSSTSSPIRGRSHSPSPSHRPPSLSESPPPSSNISPSCESRSSKQPMAPLTPPVPLSASSASPLPSSSSSASLPAARVTASKSSSLTSLLSAVPTNKVTAPSTKPASVTNFAVEKIKVGQLELGLADESYKMSLSTELAGALLLEIESPIEVIRLVLSLNNSQLLARSLDECLFRPSVFQLQVHLGEIPQMFIKPLQDPTTTEWKQLDVRDIPSSSKLDLIARSSVYEIAMKFKTYVELMQVFIADLLIKQRLQLVTMNNTPASASILSPISPLQQPQLPTVSTPNAILPLQLNEQLQALQYPLLNPAFQQTQQVHNQLVGNLASQLQLPQHILQGANGSPTTSLPMLPFSPQVLAQQARPASSDPSSLFTCLLPEFSHHNSLAKPPNPPQPPY